VSVYVCSTVWHRLRVLLQASDVMKNCMMYKMCYYRFGETMAEFGTSTLWIDIVLLLGNAERGCYPFLGQGGGFDRVRHAVIGKKDISFKYMEEAFTSEHWMVRIYRYRNTYLECVCVCVCVCAASA